MQAKYAKEAQEEATKVGEGLFAGVQCKCPVHWSVCTLAEAACSSCRDLELVLLLPCQVSCV